jgi:hypothetical protein
MVSHTLPRHRRPTQASPVKVKVQVVVKDGTAG